VAQLIPKRFIRGGIRVLEEEGGTDENLEGAWKCNRIVERTTKRVFTAPAAARAVCSAIRHGASKAEIDKEIRKRCLPSQEKICDCQEVYNTLRLVLTAAAAIAILIAISRAMPVAIPVILSTVVIRFFPRAIRLLLGRVRSDVLKLPDATRTIEGVFVRVRETVAAIDRVNR
jgi:hypothetical protein